MCYSFESTINLLSIKNADKEEEDQMAVEENKIKILTHAEVLKIIMDLIQFAVSPIHPICQTIYMHIVENCTQEDIHNKKKKVETKFFINFLEKKINKSFNNFLS